MYIARNLKILRKSKGLGLKDIAEVLGVTIQAINQYEKGSRIPGIDAAVKIADYFNISIDELVNTRLPDIELEKIGFKEKMQIFLTNAWKDGVIDNQAYNHMMLDLENED